MAQLLTEEEIQQQASVLNGWTVEGSRSQLGGSLRIFFRQLSL